MTARNFPPPRRRVFLDGFTFRRFLEDCYSENRRRMGAFDAELLRPSFLPQLAETALWRHAPVELPRQAAPPDEKDMAMKWASLVALLAGLVAAVYLVWAIGFSAVIASIARAGFGVWRFCASMPCWFSRVGAGLVFPVAAGGAPALPELYLARLVRDSIAEISPFSPVGGMVAAARLMILKGMNPAYAAASVAADATTEAMAQAVFLAFGLGLGFTQFRHCRAAAL